MATPETAQPSGGSDFARRAGLVSAATLVSRVLGLVREQLFALTLGATAQADAFLIAYRIPNLLRDLFAEGALSAAFVPAYARAHSDSPERAFALARRLLSLLTIVLGALVLVGVAAAPALVDALAGGFRGEPGKRELAIALTRWMMPILPLVSFAAVAMGILNARDRFTLPSIAPALFNVVNILVAVAALLSGAPPVIVAGAWAAGAVLGSLAQWMVQWPGLRDVGFRAGWDPDFSDPRLGEIFRTMAPATLGLAAVQINLFITSSFASHTPSAVSWLNYAFRILYLPMGLFGVAVGVVAGSRLARQLAEGRRDEAHAQVVQALRLLVVLTVPAAVGLFVAARPIVRLIYERGAFDAADTVATADALALMSFGLVAYASTKVLVPFFYAAGRPRVAVLGTLAAVVTNAGFILLAGDAVGYLAAALAMALGNLVNGGMLAVAYGRSVRNLFDRSLLAHVLRVLVASAVMAFSVFLLVGVIEDGFGVRGLAAHAAAGLLPVAAGALVFGAAGRVLGIPEVASMWSRITRAAARA
jgi:putative peptidoglycan lipid II flippase